jgi:glycosyltransferase involved in cell wall biosynthesis
MPTTSNPPRLSVVIPAYNESALLSAGVLNPVVDFLRQEKLSFEIVLVDDGSTDNTLALLHNFAKHQSGVRTLSIPHGGKAAAVMAGMMAARGRYILFTDMDQSTPISHVKQFLHLHDQGYQVVIATRGGGAQTKHDTLIRKIRSQAFVTLVQLVALPGIVDSQCGFKSFEHQSARKIFSSLKVCRPQGVITGGYMGAFDVEVLFLARKFGYRIAQSPVNWIKIPSTRLNIWREPIKMLFDVLRIRLTDIQGKYA